MSADGTDINDMAAVDRERTRQHLLAVKAGSDINDLACSNPEEARRQSLAAIGENKLSDFNDLADPEATRKAIEAAMHADNGTLNDNEFPDFGVMPIDDRPEDAYADNGRSSAAKAEKMAGDRHPYAPAETTAPKVRKPADFGAFYDGEGADMPTPSLIKKVLPLAGLAFLGGQSGAGKTFVAIHLSVCLAAMLPFFGKKARQQSAILYAAAEGQANIRPRLKAAKRALGIDEPLPIKVFTRVSFPSTDKEFAAYLADVKAEVAELRQRTKIDHVTIVIDTTSAAFTLQDENSSAEITALCKRARRLGEECDALVLLLHHFGKDATRGMRGSSAWRDNTDHGFSLITKRDPNTSQTSQRNLNIEKSRIGTEGPLSGFTLETMQLGVDEDGDPIEEAYVKQSDYSRIDADKPKAKTESRAGLLFRNSFSEALHNGVKRRIEKGGPQQAMILCAKLSDVREHFARGHGGDEDAVRKAFYREMKGIAEQGRGFSCETDRNGEKWIWRPDTTTAEDRLI